MSKPRVSVLVIGGSGVFGTHLCRRLAQLKLFQIQVGGRSLHNAIPFITELREIDPGCDPRFVLLDRNSLSAEELRRLGVATVVDAAGPFQNSSYSLVEAAIAAGTHYIDLADSRSFVAGIGGLDLRAKNGGVAIITGASSTPAVSNAVLRDLTAGWRSIDRIWVSIVPGSWSELKLRPTAPPMPGRSVIEAILSWTGEPVRIFEDGRWQIQTGWSGLRKVRLGHLGWRRASLAETPDLDILVNDFNPRVSARFNAGLDLGFMHNGLRILATLRHWRLLPRLTAFTGLLQTVATTLAPYGSNAGGMIIEVDGVDQGGLTVRAEAQLIATNGHGPIIPSLAAVALLKQIADGRLTYRGASHAGLHLKTKEIIELVPDLSIKLTTETRPHAKPLFGYAMGNPFGTMPSATQTLHRGTPAVIGEGAADIDAPDNFAGRLISALFRFPKPGKEVPISVLVEQTPAGERWLRRYPGRDMLSFMGNPDAKAQTIEERFGPFAFRMNISGHANGLDMEMVSARFGALKLPRFLTPDVTATERTDTSNRHLFDVSIRLPLIGKIVRYAGWLTLK
jgi:saccharopine dehydrogenase-like NADP-dependent oxidoreductase